MESINLEDLPIEILINIIKRVKNRWNLSLVNWNFYELCCQIEANRFRIKLIDVRKYLKDKN